jgi:hypothetical protein
MILLGLKVLGGFVLAMVLCLLLGWPPNIRW